MFVFSPRRRVGLALALFAVFVISGCASITKGSNQKFRIESQPAGATATLSNGISCTTPCELKLKRRKEFQVTITKEGYEPITAAVRSSVRPSGGAAMAGNLVLGGVIGAAVDAGTGAAFSLRPNPMSVVLAPIGSGQKSELIDKDAADASDGEDEKDSASLE